MAEAFPGVFVRPDGRGGFRFQVRVRRGGVYFNGTYASAEEALDARAQALAASRGEGEWPVAPRASVEDLVAQEGFDAAAGVVTVMDAAVRLAVLLGDGSVLTRTGAPYRPSVVREYKRSLKLHVLPRIGLVPVAELDRMGVLRLVGEIARDESAAVARKALTALRVALRVCVERGELAANPCEAIGPPPEGTQPAEVLRVLSVAEAALVVDEARLVDEGDGRSFALPLVVLALDAGLQMGEVLALRWSDVDRRENVVEVRGSLDRVKRGGVYAVVPARQPRRVELTTRLGAVLEAHARFQAEAASAAGVTPDASWFVFRRPDGGPFAAHGLPRAVFARVVDGVVARLGAAELPGVVASRFRFSDLRHTFVAHLLEAGLSIEAVSMLLGFPDSAPVWRRYGSLVPKPAAGAAVSKLEQLRAARVGEGLVSIASMLVGLAG